MLALFVILADPDLIMDRDGRWCSQAAPRVSPAHFDEREEAEKFARLWAHGKQWFLSVRKV